MPPDLGVKYTCFSCGTKFYDLKKPVPTCPKCGADQRDSPPPEQPAAERKRARSKTPPEVEALPAVDDEAPGLAGDDEEERDEPDDAAGAEAFDEEA